MNTARRLKKLLKNSMTIDELKSRLERHDHYYEMSDDHSAFLRGQADRAEILVELRKIPLHCLVGLIEQNVPKERVQIWFNDLLTL